MRTLERTVGAAAVDVTLAGVALTGAQHAGVTIRRGRSSVDEQPTAATCVLNVYENALTTLPMPGDPLEVRLGADALTWLGILDSDTAAVRFVGTVTDARIVPGTVLDVDQDVVQVVAASPLARLGRTYVGDVPWPQELDGQRAWRIIRATGDTGSDFVTFVRPDLLTDPTGWVFTRTGATGTWAPILNASDPYDNFTVADSSNPGTAPGRDYYVGTTVPVTPGRTYRLRASYRLGAAKFTSLKLVMGPSETTVRGAFTDTTIDPADPDSGLGGSGYYEHDDNVTSDLYTVPAGVTSLAIGFALYGQQQAGSLLAIKALSLVPFEPGSITEIDGGTVEILGRDVDRQQALGLLTSLAFDARGVIIDRRDGGIEYADADDRRGAATAVTLDAAEVIVGTEWAVSLAGVVNEATLSYGAAAEGSEQPTVTVTDQASIDARGRAAISRTTPLALEADAQRAAARIVGLGSTPAYRMSRLLVDLLRTVTDPAKRLAVLDLEQSALVEVTGFPTSGPLTTGRLWLEGWTEEITASSWRHDLTVSDYLAGGPGVLFDEVDPALTYTAVPDTVTYTSSWGYDPT